MPHLPKWARQQDGETHHQENSKKEQPEKQGLTPMEWKKWASNEKSEKQKQKRRKENLEQKPQPKDGPSQRKLRKEDTPCFPNCNAKALRLPLSPRWNLWKFLDHKKKRPDWRLNYPEKWLDLLLRQHSRLIYFSMQKATPLGSEASFLLCALQRLRGLLSLTTLFFYL